ncbi:MAG: copper homeostasis protein CutC [Roseibium sp.]
MLLEVCVDTIEGAKAAVRGGAGRIELCSALSEGGLTPSLGLMKAAADLPVPCFALIRPRGGMFHFSTDEEQIMLSDIEASKSAGLAGVVLGAQGRDNNLDTALLARLSERANGMDRTLHRVIDVVPDPLESLDIAIDLAFDRVLTSGAAPSAQVGVQLIAKMVNRANGRISIMPGCGLNPANVCEVIAATDVTEIHASCSIVAPGDPAFSDFGPASGSKITSETAVRDMVAAIQRTAKNWRSCPVEERH